MRNLWQFALFLAVIVAASKVSAAAPKSKGKTPKPDADGWYSLFNGKDLKGWKLSEDNPDTFKVVDGEIVVNGKVCHLYYAGPVNHANFKNFEWKCDVMTKPGSNSGMYFHTKYQPTGFPSTRHRVPGRQLTQRPDPHRQPVSIERHHERLAGQG